jgi:tRNA U34 5-methylaminomethyl-2-thiouridine-forming methyltransferase MnmC
MLQPDDLERIRTADGSTTLRHLRLGVLYRSEQGARTESAHVFLEGTRIAAQTSPWTVLELGFGEAWNFRGAVGMALERSAALRYVAVDCDPIPPEHVEGEGPGAGLAREALAEVRRTRTTCRVQRAGVSLTLHPFGWPEVQLEAGAFGSVFHDPFAPSVNPEAWTEDCFAWSRAAMSPAGLLATYSAAGHIRRAMARAGLFVARAPGPGRKREITLASPAAAELGDLRIKYRPC